MNYNFKKSINSEVTITVDPSVVDRKIKRAARSRRRGTLDDVDKQTMNGSSVRGIHLLGMESGLSKDERLFRLSVAVNKNQVKSISEAATFLAVSPGTIKKYLKELNMEGVLE